MRRALVVAVSATALAALSGCPAKPKSGECKTSADCAQQEGYGKICVEGRCQECGSDTDCQEGFVCRGNACVPKPECAADADCPEGQRCEGERCVAPPEGAGGGEAGGAGAMAGECADTQAFTVRFGFDQATLGGDSQGTLQRLADCLKQAPAARVTIAGHADERGTTQYNVALAARRAEAARKYLADLGAGGRLETVSFGEEQPLCSDSSEDCWARNRRAEFQVER
jgi:peptidoglycan-associated lipoprotein